MDIYDSCIGQKFRRNVNGNNLIGISNPANEIEINRKGFKFSEILIHEC